MDAVALAVRAQYTDAKDGIGVGWGGVARTFGPGSGSSRRQSCAQAAARSENRRTRNSISAATFGGLGPPGGITILSAIGGADQSLMTASRPPPRRSPQTTNSG